MKKFNNIPNRPYVSVEDGKIRYHSRSVAICAVIILSKGNGEYYTLVHTRGEGCPDEKGKLSFNCGYLDWNETLESSVKRELWEELGIDIDSLKTSKIIRCPEIDDSITGENSVKQNITIRYQVLLDYYEINEKLMSGEINNDSESRGGEPNEVEKILIMSFENKAIPEDWAFNHSAIFNDFHDHYFENK